MKAARITTTSVSDKCSDQEIFDAACEFAEPLCFGELTDLHQQCFKEEYCFDDASVDLEALKK